MDAVDTVGSYNFSLARHGVVNIFNDFTPTKAGPVIFLVSHFYALQRAYMHVISNRHRSHLRCIY